MSTCYFCNKPVTEDIVRPQDIFSFSGCLCGKYSIKRNVFNDKEYYKLFTSSRKKQLFSGYLRNNQVVKIDEDFVNNKLAGIIEYCETITLQEKIQKVREYFYKKTSFIGENVHLLSKEAYNLFYFV